MQNSDISLDEVSIQSFNQCFNVFNVDKKHWPEHFAYTKLDGNKKNEIRFFPLSTIIKSLYRYSFSLTHTHTFTIMFPFDYYFGSIVLKFNRKTSRVCTIERIKLRMKKKSRNCGRSRMMIAVPSSSKNPADDEIKWISRI